MKFAIFKALLDSGLKSKVESIFHKRLSEAEAWVIVYNHGQGVGVPDRDSSLITFKSRATALSYMSHWFINYGGRSLDSWKDIGVARVVRSMANLDSNEGGSTFPGQSGFASTRLDPESVLEFHLLEVRNGNLVIAEPREEESDEG